MEAAHLDALARRIADRLADPTITILGALRRYEITPTIFRPEGPEQAVIAHALGRPPRVWLAIDRASLADAAAMPRLSQHAFWTIAASQLRAVCGPGLHGESERALAWRIAASVLARRGPLAPGLTAIGAS